MQCKECCRCSTNTSHETLYYIIIQSSTRYAQMISALPLYSNTVTCRLFTIIIFLLVRKILSHARRGYRPSIVGQHTLYMVILYLLFAYIPN